MKLKTGLFLSLLAGPLGYNDALIHEQPLSAGVSRDDFYRRLLIGTMGILGASSSSSNMICLAEETDVQRQEASSPSGAIKPYAPLSALLPATRIKLWIEKAAEAAKPLTITDTENRRSSYLSSLKDLNDILQNPPMVFVKEPPLTRSVVASTAQLTAGISSANKVDSRQNRRGLNVADRMAAALNQADVERQWGMLQYGEAKKEKSNAFRAAFNYYTQQLQFDGDRFLLTASKEERKQMIRNDKIPTLTAVVVSDLDLRDLYRNQFLTGIDDLRAEVAYQVSQTPETIDIADTLELLSQVRTACQNWFDLIDPRDVEVAVFAVSTAPPP